MRTNEEGIVKNLDQLGSCFQRPLADISVTWTFKNEIMELQWKGTALNRFGIRSIFIEFLAPLEAQSRGTTLSKGAHSTY